MARRVKRGQLTELAILLALVGMLTIAGAPNSSPSAPRPSGGIRSEALAPLRLVGATGVAGLGQSLNVQLSNVQGNQGGDNGLYYGFATAGFVPAMAAWTVEFWAWNLTTSCKAGQGSGYGLLNTTAQSQPLASAQAGITANTSGIFFTWPGGGSWQLPSGGGGCANAAALGASTPSAFLLDYDGSNVRGYINGQLQFTQASSAATTATLAGFFDNTEWDAINLDEFRISNIARAVGSSYPLQTSNYSSDANTVLLWHMDDYPTGKVNDTVICDGGVFASPCPNVPQYTSVPGLLTDSSGNGQSASLWWGWKDVPGGGGELGDYLTLSENQFAAPNELGGPDEYCVRCHMYKADAINAATGEYREDFTDLTIPGRGYGLTFTRSYSTLNAGQDGPLGFGWTDRFNSTITFDGGGNPTVHEEDGTVAPFSLTSGSACSAVYQPPPRVFATLTVDGTCTHYVLTRAAGTQLQFNFGSPFSLSKIVDRNGYADTLAYSAGLLSTVTDQAGRTLTFSYYTQTGHIQTIADPAGRRVTFSYTNGDLTGVQDVAGSNSSYQYGQTGPHTGVTPPANYLTTYKDAKCVATSGCSGVVTEFDTSARGAYQTDALGRVTQLAYDVCMALSISSTTNGACDYTKITDPAGNVEMQEYEGNLLLTDIQGYGSPQQTATSYGYDSVTLEPALITDANGNVWRSTYDESSGITRGDLLSSTDPLSRSTSYAQYNAFGEPQQVTDPNGVTTTYGYDSHGNRTGRSLPVTWNGTTQTATTTYNYADMSHPGDLTSLIDADNNTWTYTYDGNGDLATSKDPLGDTTKYFYDAVGRPTCTIEPRSTLNSCPSKTSAFVYLYTTNAWGDMLSSSNGDGAKTSYLYDQNRNRTQLTDPVGNVNQYTFDLDNELTSETNGVGSSVQRTQQTLYDADGRLSKQIDGLNNPPTVYGYDALGRLNTLTDPLNRVSTYTYDGNGNQRSIQLYAGGPVTGYCYDAANQLSGISYSNGACGGAMDVSYTYTADGRRASMVDATGTTTYGYDTANQLRQTVAAGQEVDYGYNLRGLITSLTYPAPAPSNHLVTRSYDAAGRLSSVSVSTAWVSLAKPAQFTYDADSNLCLTNYGNGVVGAFSYDNADRLASSKNTMAFWQTSSPPTACNPSVPRSTLLSLAYTRNLDGYVTAENSSSYGYDALARLSSGAGTTYTMDAADRLTKIAPGSGSSTTLGYDGADEVSSSATGSTSYTYAFDQAGDRHTRTDQAGGVSTYDFDQLRRLTSFVPSGSGAPTYGYSYNGDGLRVAKTTNGATSTTHIWDLAEGLPLMLMDGSTSYVTGPGGLPLEQITSSGATYFYQADQLGSTRLITNSTGTGVNTYTYDGYGNLTASTGSLANPYQFAGQYLDSESGFYYLRAREYDPATGQFMSEDPLTPATRQPYSYVSDNPLSATDPNGLFLLDEAFGAGFEAGGYWEIDWSGAGDWISSQAGAINRRFAVGIAAVASCGAFFKSWFDPGEGRGENPAYQSPPYSGTLPGARGQSPQPPSPSPTPGPYYGPFAPGYSGPYPPGYGPSPSP